MLLFGFNSRFLVLSLPDNELNELADNFFCHLHDHCHANGDDDNLDDHQHSNEDLTNELNPLRNRKVRKSVLENQTVLVLNENHLDMAKLIVDEKNQLICANCNYCLGYKGINIYIYIYTYCSYSIPLINRMLFLKF